MPRTPRSFDGTGRTGKILSELLPGALRAISLEAGREGEEVFRAWPLIIGPAMAPMTEPISYRDGILIVRVRGATLYSLLSQHEQPRLLKSLQGKFPVRNLVFRIG
jgi:hypothetical protein